MWYSTGTVSVTNGSGTVTGSGTAFLANARIGDGIVIQGSTAMHEITGIASDTSLTIKPGYTGTTGSGRQFAVAPMLGYDKDLSDAFNEIRLQFGDTLSALKPWAYAATANAALDELGFSASGKIVATGTAAQGRGALWLGTAATANVTTSDTDTTAGRVLRVGDGGLLGPAINTTLAALNSRRSGFYYVLTSGSDPDPDAPDGGPNPICIHSQVGDVNGGGLLFDRAANPAGWLYAVRDGVVVHRLIRTSGNTTVDSNGFLKNSSPIIKLHSDRMETEAEGTFERLGTGHYRITGCNGLRLTDGWYIETPHDRNGNKYFNTEWEQDSEPDAEAGVLEEPADVTLTIRCYERVWNPATGQHENGDPVDIPDGRWIDLRMNEVRVPEEEIEEPDPTPELPSPPAEPEIPSVVPMASAKLALLYADLYEPVEAYIEGLPEPHRTAALIEWNHRQTLERDHPLVEQVATGLGLTEKQLDELFLDAAGR